MQSHSLELQIHFTRKALHYTRECMRRAALNWRYTEEMVAVEQLKFAINCRNHAYVLQQRLDNLMLERHITNETTNT